MEHYEQDYEQVFPGSPRARRADGSRQRGSAWLSLAGGERYLARAEPQSPPQCLGWPTAHRTAEVGDEVLKSPGPTTITARKAIRDFLAESSLGTVRLNTAEPLHRQAYLHGKTMRWKILEVPDIASMPTGRPLPATRTDHFGVNDLCVNRKDRAIWAVSNCKNSLRQQPGVVTSFHGAHPLQNRRQM